mmetsp:Transcript_4909/g.7247  ORF Transcript_4909/g.7247 Transcript_4909/m.7247 type:complete len:92 (-) Transcript_4909:692-967(-)
MVSSTPTSALVADMDSLELYPGMDLAPSFLGYDHRISSRVIVVATDMCPGSTSASKRYWFKVTSPLVKKYQVRIFPTIHSFIHSDKGLKLV